MGVSTVKERYIIMSKQIHNNKHLTLDERKIIQTGIENRSNKAGIARTIGKDPTTIAKEIRKHRIFKPRNQFIYPSVCIHRQACGGCKKRCSKYEEIKCNKRDKSPGACNKCPNIAKCHLDKYFYYATQADKEYKKDLVDFREGINLTTLEAKELAHILKPLLDQGQSLYQIKSSHNEIKQCIKTLYNYIESGVLSVKNIDLPKKVTYKIRSSGSSEPTDKAIYEGRTYKDLQAFLKEFPDTRITEMDTVLGCEGSRKVLLTFHFSGCSFMMAYLLDSKESRHVKNVFDSIEHAIGTFSFTSAFSLILTDRGGEFQIPDALECGEDNLIRTSIYYCDPMCF